MKSNYLILAFTVLIIFVSTSSHALGRKRLPNPVTVQEVSLDRYAGKWFEIAHSPNFFQRNCKSSTAEYEVLDEQSISVYNTCYKFNGKTSHISGTARIVDAAVPSKLKVKFNLFARGDYWITELDSNYQWAVVSSPGKKFTFILSRTAPMDQALQDKIIADLKAKGFNTDSFIFDQY